MNPVKRKLNQISGKSVADYNDDVELFIQKTLLRQSADKLKYSEVNY